MSKKGKKKTKLFPPPDDGGTGANGNPVEPGRAAKPAVLLSIRPVWLARILAGEKTVELRKWFPDLRDAPMYLYATAPRQAVVACAVIDEVVVAPPAELWKQFAADCAVPRDQFDAYYGDRARGAGVRISQVAELEALPLSTLRRELDGFSPPMSHQLVPPDHELRPLLAALGRAL